LGVQPKLGQAPEGARHVVCSYARQSRACTPARSLKYPAASGNAIGAGTHGRRAGSAGPGRVPRGVVVASAPDARPAAPGAPAASRGRTGACSAGGHPRRQPVCKAPCWPGPAQLRPLPLRLRRAARACCRTTCSWRSSRRSRSTNQSGQARQSNQSSSRSPQRSNGRPS